MIDSCNPRKPLFFFFLLWDALKEKICVDSPENLEQLKSNVRQEMAAVDRGRLPSIPELGTKNDVVH